MGEFRSKIKQAIPGLKIEAPLADEDFIPDCTNVPKPPGLACDAPEITFW